MSLSFTVYGKDRVELIQRAADTRGAYLRAEVSISRPARTHDRRRILDSDPVKVEIRADWLEAHLDVQSNDDHDLWPQPDASSPPQFDSTDGFGINAKAGVEDRLRTALGRRGTRRRRAGHRLELDNSRISAPLPSMTHDVELRDPATQTLSCDRHRHTGAQLTDTSTCLSQDADPSTSSAVLHVPRLGRVTAFLALCLVAGAAASACAPFGTSHPNSDVQLVSCTESGNEAQASGTVFNDHPSSADYRVTVAFYRGTTFVGSASDDGILLNTHNEAPFAHDTWFATLDGAPPGAGTCKLASVTRTDLGSPSGTLTRPSGDVSLSNCEGDAISPSATVDVYNDHSATGSYTVNVRFAQAGRTLAFATTDAKLDDLEPYGHNSEAVVANLLTASTGPVTCALAGVYRWSH